MKGGHCVLENNREGAGEGVFYGALSANGVLRLFVDVREAGFQVFHTSLPGKLGLGI